MSAVIQHSLLSPQRTYGCLTLDDDVWVMSSIPPHVAIRLKNLFPRIEKARAAPFRFPNDDVHAADLSWFLDRYPMRISEADWAFLERRRREYERSQVEMERILAPDYRPPTFSGIRDGWALRDYQGRAVQLLGHRGSLLLGDEVGLGKTYTCAGACLLDGALPAAIVVEPHLQMQWKRCIESFTTLSAHCIKTTKAHSLPRADVYIFRYSNVAGWVDIFKDLSFGLVAYDEIQSLRRGDSSQKGQACQVLSAHARYRLGLTATPIYGYGIEIFEVMRFIDSSVLGVRHDFIREWTRDGHRLSDPDALGSYLREQHVFLRRRRPDVARELPPVNRIVEPVAYDEKVARSADELAHQLAIRASSGSFIERGQASRDLDALIRHRTGLSKAAAVASYVRILLEAGEPVLLVGWHRDVYDVWLDQLADFKPAMYTGSESTSQKGESVRRFLEGETDLFIMSLRSGAGLDGLQDRCQTVVFGELDWSPGIHHQVIGRLDRDRTDGESNRVMAIFLVAQEGSDPPMTEVLGLKSSEAAGVVDPGLGVQRVSRDKGHLNELVQRYLKKRPHSGSKT
jgi:SNF2 family DNA or RNA helicase